MPRRCAGYLFYLFLVCLLVSSCVFLLTTPRRPRIEDLRSSPEPFPWEYESDSYLDMRAGPNRNLQGALRGSDFLMRNTRLPRVHKRPYKYSIVQESRHMAVESTCHHSNQTWQDLSEQQRQVLAQRIIVNEDHHLLYCAVPLVGMGPWMKVLYFLGMGQGLSDISKVPTKELGARKNFVYLSSFSPEEQERRIRSYLSFMVTRHPFLRIAIAYKLKFEASNTFFHERFGKEIVRKYRSGTKGNPTGDDVQFSEFVQYLVGTRSSAEMNEHWQPLETLCRPCEVGYDFVLHHETLQGDARELLVQAQLSNHIPSFPVDSWDYISMQYVQRVFRGLSPALIGKLVEQYSNDFALFSYSSLF